MENTMVLADRYPCIDEYCNLAQGDGWIHWPTRDVNTSPPMLTSPSRMLALSALGLLGFSLSAGA